MIPAILIGREGSKGFPKKNIHLVLGKALMEYPLISAIKSNHISEIYLSTDSDKIKEIGRGYRCKIIDRPESLCTENARCEDVFVHAYEWIKADRDIDPHLIEYLVLLMCNSPMITPEMINEGIRILNMHGEYDSAVSVSRYNMFSPLRARKIESDGLLHPFVPFSYIGDVGQLDSDRDSQGDCWFADMGVAIVRPRCIDNIEDGLLPQRWMGQKIYPLKQEGGFDVDYEWEIPLVENWLRRNGISE